MSIRKLISSLMERPTKDVTSGELSKEIGVDPSTVSNFFNYKNELSFCHLFGIVRYLKQGNEREIMEEIIKILVADDQKQPIRHAMEYLSTTGNIELLEFVVQSQLKSDNKENRDWAAVYALSVEFQKGTTDDSSLFMKIINLRPKFLETRIFMEILKLNVFYRQNNFGSFSDKAQVAEKLVLTIKSDYIRYHYLARVSEILAKSHLLVFNNPKKARFYANNVLNSECICPSFKYNSYYIVGMSYFFENYEECMKNLEMYVDQLEKYGKNRRDERIKYVKENDMCFARILWGRDLDNFYTPDILEMAHYECRHGDKGKANELLDTYENKEDPFYLCYKGMATDNFMMIFDAGAKLVASGQKFFANIPNRELENSPHGEMLKTVINSFYIA